MLCGGATRSRRMTGLAGSRCGSGWAASGEPGRHEDGYIGLDVHRVARIAAMAHGGQVVLSEATRLRGSRPPPTRQSVTWGFTG